eukprot:CAMPEP_0183315496 /NCGR_PEP_ID=MMETSP0160_2-20130417/51967_1 /TAXON_ID=2839 ORGANISM="Odontella Sinensis, Strain Grunow 1884" /NCGR_SAMPLE_ID=MMETSP0160_2 /ASSEMBLY_ACC=CAM_ASM_000250 /LENGTH=475 /DNA_ID=CAMNT_0025481061 /DNA_START=150 /DNA_END=1577 /DNA_ORIENTATION=-
MEVPGAFAQGFGCGPPAPPSITRINADVPTTRGRSVPIAAVIVTIRHGATYDQLFTAVPQKAAPGTRVAAYLVDNVGSEDLLRLLELRGDGVRLAQGLYGDGAASLLDDLAAADPGCVVFNWECCSGCSNDSFPGEVSPIPFMAYLLRRSFMVMCSDFSLKALIRNWNAFLLGANPFEKVGEFGDGLTLRFDPQRLSRCPDSAQLQILGELCDSGEAKVHAMNSTIVYAVDGTVSSRSHPHGCENGWAELEVLTIATELGGKGVFQYTGNRSHVSTIGAHYGLAGHCLLKYPSGGRLLTSCPHWIELSNLSVTKDNLMNVAKERYGAKVSECMEDVYASLPSREAQEEYIQEQSKAFVMQTTPSPYSASIVRGPQETPGEPQAPQYAPQAPKYVPQAPQKIPKESVCEVPFAGDVPPGWKPRAPHSGPPKPPPHPGKPKGIKNDSMMQAGMNPVTGKTKKEKKGSKLFKLGIFKG